MADFSPTELDQIEDLLEELEFSDALPGADLSSELGQRLGEYRDILRMSREALPLEEPDVSLLAGVMAEARQTAFNATTTAAGVVAGTHVEEGTDLKSRSSWLSRWLPALALATSAAGVLFWMRPELEEASGFDSTPQPLASRDSDEGSASAKSNVRDPSDAVAQRESHDSEAEDAPTADGPLEPGEAASDEVRRSQGDAAPASTSGKSYVRPANNRPKPKEGVEEDGEQVVPEPIDKDQAWSDLERAHSLRRGAECRTARALYRGLEDEGLKSNIRAQALAGRGLCEEFDGNPSLAQALFSQARALRLDIDGWVSAEREEMRAKGHRVKKSKASQPKSRKKKTAKSKKQSSNLMDPFDRP